jgi:hypothetical protein
MELIPVALSNNNLINTCLKLQAGIFIHIVYYYNECNGVLAQLGERLVRNEKVTGSSPVYSTIWN